jgi:hypothetical protein
MLTSKHLSLLVGLISLALVPTCCLAAGDTETTADPTSLSNPKKAKPKKKGNEADVPAQRDAGKDGPVVLPKGSAKDVPDVAPVDEGTATPKDGASEVSKDEAKAAVTEDSGEEPVKPGEVGKTKKKPKENPKDGDNEANWVITINDSTTMHFGPVKVVKKATMRATNPSGKITGDYTGTFSFHDTQKIKEANANVDGTSTTIGKNLKFTLLPYMHPLAHPKGDLHPLVKPGDGPDYQGQGTMEWVTQGSGTGQVEGRSLSGSNGRKDKVTFKIVVTGSLAKMILPSPQGEIFLNGSIRQGGNTDDGFVPEPLNVPKKKKDDGFVPEPLKVPKKSNDGFVPEPLNVPKK